MSAANNDFILRMLERLDEKLDDLMKRSADQGAALAGHISAEDSVMDSVREDIQSINDALHIQSTHLAQYNDHLKEHMRRTELLEKRVEPLERDFLEREVKVQWTTKHWKKLGLVAAALSGIAGAIWSAVQIFSAM